MPIRLVFAAATGVVWGVSFPLPGIAGLAWLVPGLLLVVTGTPDRGEAWRAGYVAGAAHYLVSLSWLRFIPFPVGAYTGWLALSFFLALFPAAWAWAGWRFAQRLGLTPLPGSAWTVRNLGDRLAASPWHRLNLWFLFCAALWVGWEMILARLFGGFPWNLLGASQYRMLPLIQIAAFTGVYGVSFVVVWFSASLLAAIVLLIRDPDRPVAWRRPLLFPALMLVSVMGAGFLKLIAEKPQPRRLQVALIQPSIPQTVIFDPDAVTNRFETLLHLTEQALATHPDLVIWPEASLPGGLAKEDFDRLVAKVREAKAWLVFGADEVENLPGTDETRAYNAAFLVGPEGKVVAGYRKRRLVMFGEYIPFVRWLPFLARLAPIGDGFQPGAGPVPFKLDALAATTSVLICFEDNFPQQAREHATPDVDFLVNVTNDAWFDRSSAQWQHAANAVFRAVENGIPLIRATNNGLSCWIDAAGRLHSPRLAEGKDVYDAGFDLVTLAWGTPGRTLYNRWGDVFGWACLAAAVLPPLTDRMRRRPSDLASIRPEA